jgi:hypothetical protein
MVDVRAVAQWLLLLGCIFNLAAGNQAIAQGVEAQFQKGYAIAVSPEPTSEQYADAGIRDIAAACAPATALRDLEWNNVRALLENGGSLWYDRAIDKGAYMVPRDGGVSVVYGGALWMAGISPDQQLKLAAVKYRNSGNDFWPGPLSNDGTAETDEATCNAYDAFTICERSDAMRHRQYFECLNDPNCDLATEFPDGYSIPSYFYDYPAHGNVALSQDYYIAPFSDFNGDGTYDPSTGDYPWYDFLQEIDCANRRREDLVPLYGDQTYYWVFNDKGNVHTESQGEPIGMEIRAQSFAFSTNDEVNNMTFCNYVLINQGTQTLTETYFAQWVDCDLGGHVDDYVGCDVQRGLGYAYNGDAFDEQTSYSLGYGEHPPAMGIDFFEGPYQDSDGIDNPLTSVFTDAVDSLGIPYGGIGIGYGDGIADNERYGMRKFLYYNWSSGIDGQPSQASHYYNYMRGYWRNGQRMVYGGNGITEASGADPSIPADYMYPGDTDPNQWGTQGIAVDPWTEQTAGNPPGDRLFLQSAGPFTLEPGDYNNITVGMVFARAEAGEPFASVELLRIADDKAQALFDNCFEIVSGPDAPDVTIRELDQGLVLFLTNTNPISNNFQERYLTFDPSTPASATTGEPLDSVARSYSFQGYKVYQVLDDKVGPDELEDVAKSRLIAQCDVEDDIEQIIDYAFDALLGLSVPTLMVDGENDGIRHSFQVTKDAFAQGSTALINYKTYHFMAIAYGYNNYEPFNTINGTGQNKQFLGSRKGAVGSIRSFSAIPHPVASQAGGTIQAADYGDGVSLTRLEGKGCGDNILDIDAATEARIVAEVRVPEVTYVAGAGPVAVYVVDPLKVPFGDFELRLAPDREDIDPDSDPEACFWQLTNLTLLNDEDPDNDLDAVRTSQDAISVRNEDLLMDWGLAVTWEQYDYPNEKKFTEPLASTIEFDDPTQPWLGGLADQEGIGNFYNWIRSGNQETPDGTPTYEAVFDDMKPGDPFDEDEVYEGILGGTWAPYALVSWTDNITFEDGSTSAYPAVAPTIESLKGNLGPITEAISGINNVDVVLTSDKSLWTRCPVLEMQPNEALAQNLTGETPEKMHLRRHASVDKNGLTATEGGNASQANLTGPEGMGWFPGYAIDIGTGERLNMAFGEDSWASADNGKDMLFNPSNRLTGSLGQAYAGGQHWIYIFKNQQFADDNSGRVPAYDQGAFLYDALGANFSSTMQRRVFRACTWVGSSLLNDGFEMLSPQDGLVPGRVKIRLRVAKRYERYSDSESDVDLIDGSVNNNNNIYTFSTRDVASEVLSNPTLIEELENIRIVPNPYYAMSKYETSKLDNRIKVTGLPEECTVRIYNIQGTLIRTYQKADPLTFLDWDLKNSRNVPIAGGLYIVHVDVPGVGEKVLKWFGVMRPTDLDNL